MGIEGSISTSILSDVLANYKTLRSTKYSNMSLTPHLHYRHVDEVKRIATKGRPSQILHNVQVNCTKSAKFWHLLGLTPAYNPVPGLPWAKFCDEKSDMKLSKMLPLLLTC